MPKTMATLSVADAWILDRLQRLITAATDRMAAYDYAAAKSLIEVFFWRDLVDNYLEMAKKRLYAATGEGALYTLHATLLAVTKMLAPFMPYVTEEIYLALFAASNGDSVHRARWPEPNAELLNEGAAAAGETLCAIARAVRRYKSESGLSLGCELARLEVVDGGALRGAEEDLSSIARAQVVAWVSSCGEELVRMETEHGLVLGIGREIG